MIPIKIVKDKRLQYLISLKGVYEDLGYTVLCDGVKGEIRVYTKGYDLPAEEKKDGFLTTIER